MNREQSDRQGREDQKSYSDLCDAIIGNTFPFTKGKVSLNAIKDRFMHCNTDNARKFRNMLIADGYINDKGEVINESV